MKSAKTLKLSGECGHSFTISAEDYERIQNDPIGRQLGSGYLWKELERDHYEVWRIQPGKKDGAG